MFTIRITFWMTDTVTSITDTPATILALYDARTIREATITATAGD